MKKIMIVFAVFTCLSVTAQDSIRVTDLISAAKIIDLSYTQKEIDTMYAGVMENFENYRLMHKEHLDNSVPMSLTRDAL
jgi:hypothetical protein